MSRVIGGWSISLEAGTDAAAAAYDAAHYDSTNLYDGDGEPGWQAVDCELTGFSCDHGARPKQSPGVVAEAGGLSADLYDPDRLWDATGTRGTLVRAGVPIRVMARKPAPSPLLSEAVWWVDASAAGADRLTDLSGNGRDAVFGAGAAAPIVLPHTGDDYLYLPNRTATLNDSVNATRAVVFTDVQVVIRGTIAGRPTGTANNVVQVGGTSTGFAVFVLSTTNLIQVRRAGATTATISTGIAPSKQWNRWTHTGATGVTKWEHSDDGATWTTVHTANHGTTAQSAGQNCYLGSGTIVVAASSGTRLYASVRCDGVLAHEFRPGSASADYLTVTNTGAGSVWTITRPASDWKAAIVDRPLVLFGGAQHAEAVTFPDVAQDKSMTAIYAVREFSGGAGFHKVLEQGKDSAGTELSGWWSGSLGVAVTYGRAMAQTGVGTSSAGVSINDGTSGIGQRTNALVIDGAQMRLYRDGVLPTTGSPTTTSPATITSNGWGLRVGNPRVGGQYFEGELLAAAVWPRALSAAEVAQVSADLTGQAWQDPHGLQVVVWSGTADSWEHDLLTGEGSMTATDGVAMVAPVPVVGLVRPAEKTPARLAAILAVHPDPPPFAPVGVGLDLAAVTIDGDLWQAMRAVVDTDQSWLWIDPDGTVRWQGRGYNPPETVLIDCPGPTGYDAVYTEMDTDADDSQLVNIVTVKRVQPDPQPAPLVYSDGGSLSAHGPETLTNTSLQLTTDAEVTQWAADVLALRAHPVHRPTELTLTVDPRLPWANRTMDALMGLGVSSLLRIRLTTRGTVQEWLAVVASIRHDVTPGTWEARIGLGMAQEAGIGGYDASVYDGSVYDYDPARSGEGLVYA